jgi:molybdate transport system substrate-binding protein
MSSPRDRRAGNGRGAVLLLLTFAIGLAAGLGCAKRAGETPAAPAPVSPPAPPAQGGESQTIEVFVPCAFAPPMVKIVELFEKEHPNIKVVRQIENVEVLTPRIEKGAKPDVFLSVGDVEMDRLEKLGRVADREDFAFVTLALVSHADFAGKVDSLKDLTKPEVKSVAIGTPDTSAGHYAEVILKQAKLWEAVQPKLIRTKFPVQLLKFAREKKVDAALAFAACLKAEQGEWKEQDEYQKLAGKLRLVEDLGKGGDYCLTIACPAAIIQGCKNPAGGKVFIDFLRRDEAQGFFGKSGFLTLAEPKCF